MEYGVMDRLKAINTEHVKAAIQEINLNGFPSEHTSKKYFLVYNNIPYPQKYIASLATQYATGKQLMPHQFSASQSHPILQSLGFSIQTTLDGNGEEFFDKNIKIAGEVIAELYYFSKEIYEKRISDNTAISLLKIAQPTAIAYINGFKQMRKGNVYKRTMNVEGTEYFLKHIYFDYGNEGLELALQSLDKHLHYYKSLEKGNPRKIRALWKKYVEILENQKDNEISIDIEGIVLDKEINDTTRQTLINARLGQGRFRKDLIEYWNSKCALTKCKTVAALKASHIKPWRACTNNERLDSNNGLLLIANLDSLFDKGLISLNNEGQVLISSILSEKEKVFFNLNKYSLRKKPNRTMQNYLSYHRKHIFIK
jgi:hypothetical protein